MVPAKLTALVPIAMPNTVEQSRCWRLSDHVVIAIAGVERDVSPDCRRSSGRYIMHQMTQDCCAATSNGRACKASSQLSTIGYSDIHSWTAVLRSCLLVCIPAEH